MKLFGTLKYGLLLICLFTAHIVEACGVCGNNYTEAEVKAYTLVTAILGLSAIIGMGTLAYWIIRKYRHAETPT